MTNKEKLKESTWKRNIFWRVLLKLYTLTGLRICKRVETEGGEIIWKPANNFDVSRGLLESNGVDIDALEAERRELLQQNPEAVK